MYRQYSALFFLVFLLKIQASAHVGSPGVVMEGMAGPYHLQVTVSPPDVIPGIAGITVYLSSDIHANVYARPVYFRSGSHSAPRPDLLQPVAGTPGQFQGNIWLMSGGSSSVEIQVEGGNGRGEIIVPVVAIATAQRVMPPSTIYMLILLGIFLFVLLVTIVGASLSSALTKRGEPIPAGRIRAGRIGIACTIVGCALLLLGGRSWWRSEASEYRRLMFHPMHATTLLKPLAGYTELEFIIDTTGAQRRDVLAYLVPDHGKIMHMFVVRMPALDAFAHLHPIRIDSTHFKSIAPPLPKGKYLAFADIVYNTGFTETIRDSFEITASLTDSLHKMDPDDAYAFALPANVVDHPAIGKMNTIFCGKPGTSVRLSDGSFLSWENDNKNIFETGKLYSLNFALLDSAKKPVRPEPYLGMAAHAAIIRDDGNVYIHLHPVGTISVVAASSLVTRFKDKEGLYNFPDRNNFRDSIDRLTTSIRSMSEEERNNFLMQGMNMKLGRTNGSMSMDNMISFPYIFPQPGNYRVWVQCKRNGKVLTAAFDMQVQQP